MINLEHPANAGILEELRRFFGPKIWPLTKPQSATQGTHPDIEMRFWDEIPRRADHVARATLFQRPALVHANTGILLGIAIGTSYAIRLPPKELKEALSTGAYQAKQYADEVLNLTNSGAGWIFGRGKYGEQEMLWFAAAAKFADGDTVPWHSPAQSFEEPAVDQKIIVICQNCQQKLRVPTNRGALSLKCPKCQHSWSWKPS